MSNPENIGKYKLLGEPMNGGMGKVYPGLDPTLGRKVAIKVLHDNYASDPSTVNRFLTEARAMALMNHPNIVSVYDAGDADGTTFFAMEFVEGENLGEILPRRKKLPLSEVCGIVMQIARALDYAHDKGVFHRDVKPTNILLTHDKTVKVTDFGIAKVTGMTSVTEVGKVIGTAEYMAPELWHGEKATQASDQYALAVLAFELLTGKTPFGGESPIAKGYGHVSRPVPIVELEENEKTSEGNVNSAVSRAMSKKPAERYPSAVAFAEDLARTGGVFKPKMPRVKLPNLPAMPDIRSIQPHYFAIGGAALGFLILLYAVCGRHPAEVAKTYTAPPPPPPPQGPWDKKYTDAIAVADPLMDRKFQDSEFASPDFKAKYEEDHQKIVKSASLLTGASDSQATLDKQDPLRHYNAMGHWYLAHDQMRYFMNAFATALAAGHNDAGSQVRKDIQTQVDGMCNEYRLYLEKEPDSYLKDQKRFVELGAVVDTLRDNHFKSSSSFDSFLEELRQRKREVNGP